MKCSTRKSIFVDKLRNYISSKFNTNNFNTRKINFNYERNISSLKNYVTVDAFEDLLNSSFRPSKAVVRKFDHTIIRKNDRNVARIPRLNIIFL